MSKAVLISIKPKWCELIASGEKLVEVRKTKPKIETPFKCYIYMTNGEWYKDNKNKRHYGSGKVIGEFVCDQIDEIGYSPEMHGKYISDIDDIHYVSCVDFEQMFDYLADGYGYAWHITDLVLYDMPRALRGFYHYCGDNPNCDGCELLYYSNTECGKEEFCCSNMYGCKPLKRPPQSWCYVEEVEDEQREADI
jgi:predicted transcriptional regulator